MCGCCFIFARCGCLSGVSDFRERSDVPPEGGGSAGFVDAVPGMVADALGGDSPVDWWRLRDGGGEREQVLERLHGFVTGLVVSYGLPEQVVPRCWFKHEALLQELLGLMQLRGSCFAAVAPPVAGNDFHAAFFLWRQRMREWVLELGCNAAEHYETVRPVWVDDERVAEEFRGFMFGS